MNAEVKTVPQKERLRLICLGLFLGNGLYRPLTGHANKRIPLPAGD